MIRGELSDPPKTLRIRLADFRKDEPSSRDCFRSGSFVAVPADPALLETLLTGQDAQRRRAATGLLKAAERAFREAAIAKDGVLRAANVRSQGFTATEIRSVVPVGRPESSRRRH